MAMVVCGASHTLTLDAEGNLWAFGYNGNGQCGLVNTDAICTNCLTPFKVSAISEEVLVPMDVVVSKVIPTSKKTWYSAWFGVGMKEEPVVVVPVESVPPVIYVMKNIVHISAGEDFSACVDVDGNLWMFGSNGYGQLGSNEFFSTATPRRVREISNALSVTCGARHTVCVCSEDKVYSCGDGRYYQLGNRRCKKGYSFELIDWDGEVKQVACGDSHTVILSVDGSFSVCGSNIYGQLGISGDEYNKRIRLAGAPLFVNDNLEDIIYISCGDFHTVMMNSSGQLFSFGENEKGALCLADNRMRHLPTLIEFPEDVAMFSCGMKHTTILDTSYNLWVFGLHYKIDAEKQPQFFNGYRIKKPITIGTVSSGGGHILMKTFGNEIWGLGCNRNFQLGFEGGDTIVKIPTKVMDDESNIVGISAEGKKSRYKSARK